MKHNNFKQNLLNTTATMAMTMAVVATMFGTGIANAHAAGYYDSIGHAAEYKSNGYKSSGYKTLDHGDTSRRPSGDWRFGSSSSTLSSTPMTSGALTLEQKLDLIEKALMDQSKILLDLRKKQTAGTITANERKDLVRAENTFMAAQEEFNDLGDFSNSSGRHTPLVGKIYNRIMTSLSYIHNNLVERRAQGENGPWVKFKTNYSHSETKFSPSITASGTLSREINIGFDKHLTPNLTIGVTAGYVQGHNQALVKLLEQDTKGINVGVYSTYNVNKLLYVNDVILVGKTKFNTKIQRANHLSKSEFEFKTINNTLSIGLRPNKVTIIEAYLTSILFPKTHFEEFPQGKVSNKVFHIVGDTDSTLYQGVGFRTFVTTPIGFFDAMTPIFNIRPFLKASLEVAVHGKDLNGSYTQADIKEKAIFERTQASNCTFSTGALIEPKANGNLEFFVGYRYTNYGTSIHSIDTGMNLVM